MKANSNDLTKQTTIDINIELLECAQDTSQLDTNPEKRGEQLVRVHQEHESSARGDAR